MGRQKYLAIYEKVSSLLDYLDDGYLLYRDYSMLEVGYKKICEEITEYRDTSKTLISQSYGEYAKYSITRELLTNNVKTEYFYDTNGQIYKSEWFGYDEYGNRISRAVAGIDGTPVRCPNWDWDDLCFYKMSVLYPLIPR